MTNFFSNRIGRVVNSIENNVQQINYQLRINEDDEFKFQALIRSTAACALLVLPCLSPSQSLATGLGFILASVKTLYDPRCLRKAPTMHTWTDKQVVARISLLAAAYFTIGGPLAHFVIGYTFVRAAHHSLTCYFGPSYVEKIKNLITR